MRERLQTPVFVLTDLDLGMNNWMSEQFDYPEKPLDRGKVLTKEDLDRLGGFARYRDVDGDAIGWRTLPGTKHPKAAYFTRGSGHNDAAGYTEKPDEYQAVMERLARKFESARKLVPAPVAVKDGTSRIGFLAYGTTDFALRESLDQIKKRIRQGRGLHAHPGVSVRARDSRLCGIARSRIRSRAGPGCDSWRAC